MISRWTPQLKVRMHTHKLKLSRYKEFEFEAMIGAMCHGNNYLYVNVYMLL